MVLIRIYFNLTEPSATFSHISTVEVIADQSSRMKPLLQTLGHSAVRGSHDRSTQRKLELKATTQLRKRVRWFRERGLREASRHWSLEGQPPTMKSTNNTGNQIAFERRFGWWRQKKDIHWDNEDSRRGDWWRPQSKRIKRCAFDNEQSLR